MKGPFPPTRALLGCMLMWSNATVSSLQALWPGSQDPAPGCWLSLREAAAVLSGFQGPGPSSLEPGVQRGARVSTTGISGWEGSTRLEWRRQLRLSQDKSNVCGDAGEAGGALPTPQ